MARLRRPVLREIWVSGVLREPPYDPTAKLRNGAYRGPLPVLEVGVGVSGRDLRPEIVPAAGQVWRRGIQRVRIVRLDPAGKPNRHRLHPARWVVFLDLTHAGGQRRMSEDVFLASSRIEEGA